MKNEEIKNVYCGGNHTVIEKKGEVLIFGDNSKGKTNQFFKFLILF